MRLSLTTFLPALLIAFLTPLSLAGQGTISGTITDIAGDPVAEALVTLTGNGSQTTTTDVTGFYTFTGLAENFDYTVTPSSPMDCGSECLSPADICLIDDYASGDAELSPLEFIAADYNGSEFVSTTDVAFLGAYLAGTGDLPDPCFRFLPNPTTFPDPADPWSGGLPEVTNINDLLGSVTANFHGLRIGDLNGCATPPTPVAGSLVLDLTASVTETMNGEAFCVQVVADDYTQLTGFRFFLSWEGNVFVNTIGNLAGLDGFSNSNVQVLGAQSPAIVQYHAPLNEPASLAPSTILFEVCFDNEANEGDNLVFTLGGEGLLPPAASVAGCGEQLISGTNGPGSLTLEIPVVGDGFLMPFLNCPYPVTISANNECQGQASVPATITDPDANYTLTNSYNASDDASGFYFVGETEVTYTLSDGLGDSQECTFTVTVLDEGLPILACSDDVTASIGGDVPNIFTLLNSVEDDCTDENELIYGIDLEALDCEDYEEMLGGIPYTVTATDGGGNEGVCSGVILIDDFAAACGVAIVPDVIITSNIRPASVCEFDSVCVAYYGVRFNEILSFSFLTRQVPNSVFVAIDAATIQGADVGVSSLPGTALWLWESPDNTPIGMDTVFLFELCVSANDDYDFSNEIDPLIAGNLMTATDMFEPSPVSLTVPVVMSTLDCPDENCIDFDDENIVNWQAFGGASTAIGSPGPSGSPDDFYLRASDGFGGSWIFNTFDYGSSLADHVGECLCFDVRLESAGNYRPQLRFFTGGTLTFDNTIAARFIARESITATDGWVRFCVPILECIDGSLYSNELGEWEISGGMDSCSILSDVFLNYSGIALPSESSGVTDRVGFDNICWEVCEIINPACTASLSNTSDIPCAPSLSYTTNGQGNIYGVSVTVLGAQMSNVTIGAGLDSAEISSNVRTLVASDYSAMDEDITDLLSFSLHGVTSPTQQLVVNYLDSTFINVICSDTLDLACPVSPTCLTVSNPTLECAEDGGGYDLHLDFTLPTGPDVDEVGLIKVIVTGPEAHSDSIYRLNFDPPLMPGATVSLDTLLPTMEGDSLCLLITAHDGPDERICCFADSLCLEIPFCEDPCVTPILVINEIPSPGNDESLCCYEILVDAYSPLPDYYNELNITLNHPSIPNPVGNGFNVDNWMFVTLNNAPGVTTIVYFGTNVTTSQGLQLMAEVCFERQPEETAFIANIDLYTDNIDELCTGEPLLSPLCAPLPPTCDSITTRIEVNETDSCCFYLVYENSLPEGTIDSVQINLFGGPTYGEGDLAPSSDFSFTVLSMDGVENLTFGPIPGFGAPIGPGIDTLITFCLDPAQPLDSTRIEVNSFLNGDVMEPCRDSLAALCPAPDPCDSLAAYILPDEEACCYNVFLDNTYNLASDPLQSVTVNLIGGPSDVFAGRSLFPTAPGWTVASVNEEFRRFTLNPSGDTIPQGLGQQVFQFCVAESFSTDSTYVEIAWQTATDTICADTVAAICQNCLSIEEEEIGCDNGQPTYSFTFTNYSEIPGNTIRLVYTEGVPEGIEMPDTITLTEMVGPGETYSGTILFDLSNELEGQEVCFDIILEQVLPNQAPIRCCYVTHCVASLDCGPGIVGPDGGEVGLQAYPNPANGQVMLVSDQLGAARVSLLSFTGSEAVSPRAEVFDGTPVAFRFGRLTPGVYTVLVRFADGKQGVRRIVVK